MIVEPKEIKHVKISDDQRVGITSGCWDLLHFYHYQYLVRCHALCEVLIVGVDSDDLVKKNKGKYPAVPEYHRAQMVAGLRCVDVVYIQRDINDLTLAARDVDFMFKHSDKIYGEDVMCYGETELVIVPDLEEVMSTTDLKKKIVRDSVS